jgi:hypothetical protein
LVAFSVAFHEHGVGTAVAQRIKRETAQDNFVTLDLSDGMRQAEQSFFASGLSDPRLSSFAISGAAGRSLFVTMC